MPASGPGRAANFSLRTGSGEQGRRKCCRGGGVYEPCRRLDVCLPHQSTWEGSHAGSRRLQNRCQHPGLGGARRNKGNLQPPAGKGGGAEAPSQQRAGAAHLPRMVDGPEGERDPLRRRLRGVFNGRDQHVKLVKERMACSGAPRHSARKRQHPSYAIVTEAAPGNSDAVWPSGPMPRRTRSSWGVSDASLQCIAARSRDS